MKVFAILAAAGVGALGWVFFDVNSSRIAWATMVGIITLLLLFVRQGQSRVPLLRLTIALTVILTAFTSTVLGDDRPQLGLDLQGGVSIVLFPVEGSDLSLLDTAVDTIASRVAGLGASEPEVSRQGDTIVVDIPGLKDPQRAIEIVGRSGAGSPDDDGRPDDRRRHDDDREHGHDRRFDDDRGGHDERPDRRRRGGRADARHRAGRRESSAPDDHDRIVLVEHRPDDHDSRADNQSGAGAEAQLRRFLGIDHRDAPTGSLDPHRLVDSLERRGADSNRRRDAGYQRARRDGSRLGGGR
jgi:hypothetical protein